MEKFKFIAVPSKTCAELYSKDNSEYLMKWSMKGHLRVYYYNFNETFRTYQMQDFAEAFFRDPAVYTTLETINNNEWSKIGRPATRVNVEHIPCTVTSMSFFSRIQDHTNNITRDGGSIIQAMEELINDIYISDNLRYMLLDQNHTLYRLYAEHEREQFIFRLFKHLCLGGKWCQYEDYIEPYLNITKDIYKNLLSVERYEKQKDYFVRSVIFKVTAYSDDEPICPTKAENEQNFSYLIIDPFKRQVAVLIHQLSELLIT